MEAIPKELAELDTCASLHLREISEPKQNGLRLLIDEAEVMPEEVAIRVAGTEMGTGHLVRSTANSRLFEIVWDNYVAYSVTNESYATPGEMEEFSGRFARLYSKSRFLGYPVRCSTSESFPSAYYRRGFDNFPPGKADATKASLTVVGDANVPSPRLWAID